MISVFTEIVALVLIFMKMSLLLSTYFGRAPCQPEGTKYSANPKQ